MNARLPTGTSKRLHPEGRHGDYQLWSLSDEASDPTRVLHVVINGVLFGVVPVNALERERGKLPTTLEGLKDLYRQSVLVGSGWSTRSRLSWEALGMDMDEYERRRAGWEASGRERTERHKEFEREQVEKKARAEAALINKVEDAVRGGRAVAGPDLLALAKLLKVSVPPRAAGAISKMVEIEAHRSVGPKTVARTQFVLYAEVRRKLAQVDAYR